MVKTLRVGDLGSLAGTEIGVSGWLQIDQDRIDRFADVTGDDQWIHTDPERAADGPFGATVAHGLLTLSLLPFLSSEVYLIEGARSRVNYGYDRVRFPHPVRAGDRVRDRVALEEVVPADGGMRMLITHTVEIEGVGRPACVASAVLHLVTEGPR